MKMHRPAVPVRPPISHRLSKHQQPRQQPQQPLFPPTTTTATRNYHRPSQPQIALIAFLIVVSLTFFLLAVYVSIRHRRLLGSPRLRGGIHLWREHRHERWELVGEGGDGEDKSQQLEKGERKGAEEVEELELEGGDYRYKYRGYDGLGNKVDVDIQRVSVFGPVTSRVMGVLYEVGRRVVGVVFASSRSGSGSGQRAPPVRDVEIGVGNGVDGYGYGDGYGDEGDIGGLLDGSEVAALRDSILIGGAGSVAWPRKMYFAGPAARLLRRRGGLVLSADSECPV